MKKIPSIILDLVLSRNALNDSYALDQLDLPYRGE